jgi:hypothetical protein
MAGLPLAALVTALTQYAKTTHLFDRVAPFETADPTGQRVTFDVWLGRVAPARGRSGLDSTSLRVEMTARITVGMARKHLETIDTDLSAAVAALITAYSGDLDLGVPGAEIDALGAYGDPLSGTGGYWAHNGQGYRTFDLTIPIVIDDAWTQAH